MRILVVSNVTGFMYGGVPVETARLIRGLRARGHQLAFMGDIPIVGDRARPALSYSHYRSTEAYLRDCGK